MRPSPGPWSAIVGTLVVGRFFCGFACPLGTINQATGWVARRGLNLAGRMEANRHRRLQSLKYYLLAFLLALSFLGSVQTGIIDPLPLLHRSVNLALLPLADNGLGVLSNEPRLYASAWLIGVVFLGVVGLNLVLPGSSAASSALWGRCSACWAVFPPGASVRPRTPAAIAVSARNTAKGPAVRETATAGECVMCLNCLDRCPVGRVTFAGVPSAAGEVGLPDLSPARLYRGRGRAAPRPPCGRSAVLAGAGRDPSLIRPRGPGRGALPGPLPPLRPVHAHLRQHYPPRPVGGRGAGPVDPGGQLPHRPQRLPAQLHRLRAGLPHPPRAIRPLSLDEKQGTGEFAAQGPIRMGTAFMDRGPLPALGHGPALPGLP